MSDSNIEKLVAEIKKLDNPGLINKQIKENFIKSIEQKLEEFLNKSKGNSIDLNNFSLTIYPETNFLDQNNEDIDGILKEINEEFPYIKVSCFNYPHGIFSIHLM